jgi:hypothetical protein
MSAGLRFRVYVAGRLRLEEWITDPDLATNAAERHAAVARASGEPWLLEIFDPDVPTTEAYVRFGTDRGGMVVPSAGLTPEELVAAVLDGAT